MHIKVNTQGKAGYITLDRPEALNSLTHQMITDIHQALISLENDPAVDVIVVRSASERAFCAGGDMKSTRLLAIDEKWTELQTFFEQEYKLNLHIAECSKPYISLVNGIAMGGGLGLTVHGQTMVVCENSLLAMPETAIGFFPDVGGTYFLNQLSHNAASWMSISGMPVKAHQAVTIGLATHYVHSSNWAKLTNAIEQSGAEALQSTLTEVAETPEDAAFMQLLEARRHWFSAKTQEQLISNLEQAANNETNGTTLQSDAADLLKRIQRMSPYAINLTRDLLENAKGKDLKTCLQLELKAADQAVRHADFIEGIRAVLVDKEPAVWTS